MITYILTFFMQILTYIFYELSEFKIYTGENTYITWYHLLLYFMITSIVVLIIGGLIRHNGNS